MRVAIVSTIFVAAVIAFAVHFVPCPTWATIDYWAERYQTLIAALIAFLAAGTAVLAARLNVHHQQELEKERFRQEAVRSLRICLYEMNDILLNALGPIQMALRYPGNVHIEADLENSKDEIEALVRGPVGLAEIVSRLPWRYGFGVHTFYTSARIAAAHVLNPEAAARVRHRALTANIAHTTLLNALQAAEEDAQDLPEPPMLDDAQTLADEASALGIERIEQSAALNLFVSNETIEGANQILGPGDPAVDADA